MAGVMQSTPRVEIFVLFSNFGAVSGLVVQSRARLWVLADSADPAAAMRAHVAWNRRTGGIERQELGEVASLTVRGPHAELRLVDGNRVVLVQAPCVCGAGAVGNALPADGRLAITNVSLYGHSGVTVG